MTKDAAGSQGAQRRRPRGSEGRRRDRAREGPSTAAIRRRSTSRRTSGACAMHEPILAKPVGPLVRLRRWAQRNPALATAPRRLDRGPRGRARRCALPARRSERDATNATLTRYHERDAKQAALDRLRPPRRLLAPPEPRRRSRQALAGRAPKVAAMKTLARAGLRPREAARRPQGVLDRLRRSAVVPAACARQTGGLADLEVRVDRRAVQARHDGEARRRPDGVRGSRSHEGPARRRCGSGSRSPSPSSGRRSGSTRPQWTRGDPVDRRPERVPEVPRAHDQAAARADPDRQGPGLRPLGVRPPADDGARDRPDPEARTGRPAGRDRVHGPRVRAAPRRHVPHGGDQARRGSGAHRPERRPRSARERVPGHRESRSIRSSCRSTR